MEYIGGDKRVEWEGKMGYIHGKSVIFCGPDLVVAMQTGTLVPDNWRTSKVKITIKLLDDPFK